ncbi:class I SAM-dependent DNA methyltransferase [Nonomuraea aridisoli]|uniref:SAM-dependent methyltransferase n=1 Tax=Nonomuraea aridisoli TaxID=2070368 RepID=A0A2W2E824_9ACTN|nr:class I SAM-dependent methyltransferase [Nonomuraea aridisoli]PZG20262.1 SAM-dependent methyltransferase [Nonomuraea aridisoli]
MTEPDFRTATRAAYDAMADRYAASIPERYRAEPLNHAMVPLFAELVLAQGGGAVADVGCGPGHVTAHLHALGVDAFGIDLSPGMVALAREAHPRLRFEVGVMESLNVADQALAGVVANFAILHTPPEGLPAVVAEFGRVLAPGGHLLLGFPAWDGAGPAQAYDHVVTTAYRHAPDRVAGLLLEHGLAEVARLTVAPGEDPRRGFPQAFLLARRTAP